MSNETLFRTFQKCYQDTDLTPLVELEQLERFGVEYGTEAMEEVLQLVEDNAAQDAKVIFSGHRGCGKSTLLAKVGRQMSDRYFVAFFSISDSIEMSDVNHVNILFAIALNLMLEAEKEQIAMPQGTRTALYNWFATRTRVEVNTPKSAEVSVGFDLFKLFSGKFKTEASVRNEVKHEFERNITELVAKLNEIAAVIQGASGRKVLVIIDDLDKLDLELVLNIYRDHITSLFLPGFSIVFTIPVSLLREGTMLAQLQTATDDQIVEMPVAKLLKKGERRKPDPMFEVEAVKTLCQVLHKRIPPDILASDIAEQMVFQSGGILRELIRISNRCCRICLRKIRREPERTDIEIDQAVLDEALKDLRLDFEVTLGKADYAILQTTYAKFLPEDPKAQSFLDLLHGLDVLEYRNDEVWYDVHPIVSDILQRKGLIDGGE
jgi:energy-coupling factor transporter ATP-binding protein EcfA2